MVGLLVVGLVAVGAIAMDMTRLGMLRADLQDAADAGAHSGAVQLLIVGSTPGDVVNAANAFVGKNTTAWLAPPSIDVSETGIWDPGSSSFTATTTGPNAIRVQLSFAPTGLIMQIVGVSPPVVHATAIGFAHPGPPPRPAIVQ